MKTGVSQWDKRYITNKPKNTRLNAGTHSRWHSNCNVTSRAAARERTCTSCRVVLLHLPNNIMLDIKKQLARTCNIHQGSPSHQLEVGYTMMAELQASTRAAKGFIACLGAKVKYHMILMLIYKIIVWNQYPCNHYSIKLHPLRSLYNFTLN